MTADAPGPGAPDDGGSPRSRSLVPREFRYGLTASPPPPGAPLPSLREYVAGATAVLADAGVPSPAVDARALAQHVLGVDNLVLAPRELPEVFAAEFAALIERRRGREPLQHIVGRTGFRHLTLIQRPGVFVARPETEVVAQVAIDAAAGLAEPLVVDLCCGSGAIACSVAAEVPGVRVVAIDASPEAVGLTRENAQALGLAIRVETGDVRDGDALADLSGAVDVVVANPPYIPPDAVPTEVEVREHDPDLALYGGGADGLEIPRAVVALAARLLRPGGVLVMEHAEVQASAARELVARNGFDGAATFDDLTHRPRGVRAVSPARTGERVGGSKA